MQRLLHRIGSVSLRHRLPVLATWSIALVVLGVTASLLGVPAPPRPASDTPADVRVVFVAPEGVDLRDPAYASARTADALKSSLDRLRTVPGTVVRTKLGRTDGALLPPDTIERDLREAIREADPSLGTALREGEDGGREGLALLEEKLRFASPVSGDGRVFVLGLDFDGRTLGKLPEGTRTAIADAVAPARAIGIDTRILGDLPEEARIPTPTGAFLGLLGAAIVLGAALRSWYVAGPLASGLAGLLAGAFLGTPALGTALGIALALPITLRYRRLLSDDEPEDRAEVAGAAAASAGRGVLAAAAAGAIALAAIPSSPPVGPVSALVVAIAVAAALTLQFAVLGLVGAVLRTAGRPHGDAATSVGAAASRDTAEPTGGRGLRLPHPPRVRLLERIPGAARSAITVSILVALTIPAAFLQLGAPDPVLDDAFGPGRQARFLVEASEKSVAPEKLAAAARRIADVPGVADAQPLAVTYREAAPERPSILVTPTTGPADPATARTLDAIRASLGPLRSSLGGDASVTGPGVEAAESLRGPRIAFLAYLGVLIVAAALCLGAIHGRDPARPGVPRGDLRGALRYGLAVGAAFGVTVAVYQFGWFGLVPSPGPLPVVVPFVTAAVGLFLAVMRARGLGPTGAGTAATLLPLGAGIPFDGVGLVPAAALLAVGVLLLAVPQATDGHRRADGAREPDGPRGAER